MTGEDGDRPFVVGVLFGNKAFQGFHRGQILPPQLNREDTHALPVALLT
jgi:hypothetical protein